MTTEDKVSVPRKKVAKALEILEEMQKEIRQLKKLQKR